MKPQKITSPEQHERVLSYFEKLMDAAPDSEEEKELIQWAEIIEEYEKEIYGAD